MADNSVNFCTVESVNFLIERNLVTELSCWDIDTLLHIPYYMLFIRHIHLLYLCLFDLEVQFSFFILIKLFVKYMIRILNTESYLFLSHFKFICVKLACIW